MSPFTLRPWSMACAALACAALLTAPPALAKRAPDADPRREALLAQRPPVREVESVQRTRAAGDAREARGEATGRLLRWYRHAPSGPAAAAATPRDVARAFLIARAGDLGLDAGSLDRDLASFSEKESPSGTHLRYQQVVNGVPVWRAEIVIKVAKDGQVASVQNNLRPGLALDTTPVLDDAQAIAAGVNAVKPTGKALAEYTADLSVVEFESGARLVWRVRVPNESPAGDWEVFVDAKDGRVLGVEDRAVYVTGSGRVFDPDPESKTGNTSLPDNADADSGIPFPGAYDIRTLLDLTQVGPNVTLSGPYVNILEFESPVVAPVTATHPDSFRFTRSPSSFEDVNVYFSLDQNQRYIQSLGFTNVNNRVQEVDTHGLSGADNSHYVPATKRLAFGEGGVDDAEDADVVLHEYGHSIQDNIVPGWGGGQEGAMGEGFGDFWAGSYSHALYPLHEPNFMFNWDGHNEFWPGRLFIDPTLHYPEDCCGEVHDSGTLWCSGLSDAAQSVGRTVMDRIVLDHHFALGTSATMAEAAEQIIQSDFDLYGGAHVGQLVTVFDTWGFVDATSFIPSITHTPLTDTEAPGPYAVVATITSAQPLDASSLKLHYGVGAFTAFATLLPTGNPNEYGADIPDQGTNVDVRYYLEAMDTNGGTATDPVGAPGSFHAFHVGADVTPPVITHTPIADFPRIVWPATVQATVTDNLGVNPDSVRVDWQQNGAPRQTFYLARIGLTSQWSGAFPSDTDQVVVGDLISYRITARDVATTPNAVTHPAVGFHSFQLIASRGSVLVLDDDDVAAHATGKQLEGEDAKTAGAAELPASGAPGNGFASATSIAGILNGLGFTATVELATASNPATWSNYGLLVSSSGGNEAPLANAGYRGAIEAYVAGGGKLLVEGGEVAYDAASTPGYPTFAANVLHTTDWDADNAGALLLLPGRATHPIATSPNALPATMAIAYTGFGSEDSYKPTAPAYIVYGVTAQAGNGGILVYDNTPAPQSAQIVLFGFDFKDVADLATRTQLLENAVVYLLAPEGAPNGTLAGRARLNDQTTHAGTLVTIQPTGATALTDAAGNYAFSGLYAQTYTVTATRSGYTTATTTAAVPEGGTVNDVNLRLYPQPTVQYCVSPGTAIPDDLPAGITSDIVVPDAFTLAEVQVGVNITHTYRGDLIVELRNGPKTVRLHNRSGGSADNIDGTYPTTLAVDGPGALANFAGDPSNGTWTLFVSDNEGLDVGNLVQWCVTLKGVPDSSTTVDVGPGPGFPRAAWLATGAPNPAPHGRTSIRWALPRPEHVTLRLYDVTGRLVRTLMDAGAEAGEHTSTWNGRDDQGALARPGLYIVRFRAGGFEATRRLMLTR